VSDPLRIHVRKILNARAAESAADQAKIREAEAAGHRIIDGGQIEGDSWAIKDWRTGEELVSGDGGLERCDAACKRLDPDGRWWHIDNLMDQVEWQDISSTDGIPPSLAKALEEWVDSLHTPIEEVAGVAGLDVDGVKRQLADR
jgi:hypothetical protein